MPSIDVSEPTTAQVARAIKGDERRPASVTAVTREERVQEMVQQVAPVLRATAAAAEAARQLAPEAMAALVDAGIVRALLPAAYNGAELGPVYGVKLFEELATIDSAASWVGM